MKFLSLKLLARGVNGWESPLLSFGERTTLIFAPNGSGKTPLVQAIAFCLGYPLSFREDINDRCSSAALQVQIGEQAITITRSIQKDFYVKVTTESGSSREFFSEGDFSKAIFQEFGMPVPILVSTSKEATQPYISTLLPIFYLNQDSGYVHAYQAARPFITDQFVEMVRFVFGLAPKHSYQQKKDLLNAKDELDAVNRRIVYQQKVISDVIKTVDERPESVNAVNRQLEELQRQLTELRDSMNLKGSAQNALSEILAAKDQAIYSTRRSAEDIEQRVTGIGTIRAEIESEIETLGLNEESKRVFESFEDICRNPNCGLFVGSSESYAKNLLYLKDQLKDLQRNADRAAVRLEDLYLSLRNLESEREAITAAINSSTGSSEAKNLVTAVQQVTLALFDVEQKRSAIRIVSEERAKLLRFESERENIQNKIANLANIGRADLAFNKLRIELKETISKWLDMLKTLNVSHDIEIDLDFKFKFGREPLEAITGSTKIRVVLAIHAALLELYWRDGQRPFRFLVLDTPKQQEMQTKDLAQFLEAFSTLCGKSNAQLIFSSTEYHFPVEEQDAEWNPTYAGPRQPMYLGSP